MICSHCMQELMESHECVAAGAWQACAASLVLARGGLGFDHLRFDELAAMFRCTSMLQPRLHACLRLCCSCACHGLHIL